jgi:hypothetical protein
LEKPLATAIALIVSVELSVIGTVNVVSAVVGVEHENGEAKKFYATLPSPARVGMEATCDAQWSRVSGFKLAPFSAFFSFRSFLFTDHCLLTAVHNPPNPSPRTFLAIPI